MKLLNDMMTIAAWPQAEELPLTFRLSLNEEHPIYQAHFPGNPITPGICIIQVIGEIIGERYQTTLQLHEISNIKYVEVISPKELESINMVFTHLSVVDGVYKVRGVIAADQRVYTKFSLSYQEL